MARRDLEPEQEASREQREQRDAAEIEALRGTIRLVGCVAKARQEEERADRDAEQRPPAEHVGHGAADEQDRR